MEAMKARLDELEKLLKALDLRVKAVEAAAARPLPEIKSSEGEEGIDTSQLVKLMESLKLELLGTLAKKEDLDALKKRVDTLESLTKTLNEEQEKTKTKLGGVERQTIENTDDINIIKERLKQLEQKLGNKVNCEDYDKLLLLINQLSSKST